jgi:hypothetical protein
MHHLDHLSDHIRLVGNLLNVSFELPEEVIMDHKQVYRQSNSHETTLQILRMKVQMEVIPY